MCGKLYTHISGKIKDSSYVPDRLKEFIENNDEYNGTEILSELIHEYENLAYPYKTPWQKLKDAFAEWKKDFMWRHIKRYFRRNK